MIRLKSLSKNFITISPKCGKKVETPPCLTDIHISVIINKFERIRVYCVKSMFLAFSHNMNPWEEIQIVRRQIAKLNHRLMAVELENQQQQQREMILTALVTCYFIGKFFIWLNRSP